MITHKLYSYAPFIALIESCLGGSIQSKESEKDQSLQCKYIQILKLFDVDNAITDQEYIRFNVGVRHTAFVMNTVKKLVFYQSNQIQIHQLFINYGVNKLTQWVKHASIALYTPTKKRRKINKKNKNTLLLQPSSSLNDLL